MTTPHTNPTKPLLKDAEQNIGNSSVLAPQVGLPTVIPQSNPPRILNLGGGSSSTGQTTSVIFTASRILQGDQNPNPGFPGPVTGVLEFGNGGRSTTIEFDLALGPFAGLISSASSALQPQDGVTVVTVPTGVLRAYARYDNLLLAPLLGTNPPVSLAQYQNVAVVGPGGPVDVTDPTIHIPPGPGHSVIPAEPVLVKAMAAYFGKARANTYKTIWCYCSAEINGSPAVQVSGPATVGGYKGYAFFALPAFTRKVKVLRFPDTTGLSILLHNGIRPTDYVTIPSGPTAPEIKVVGDQNIIGITSGSDKVALLAVVCEIGI